MSKKHKHSKFSTFFSFLIRRWDRIGILFLLTVLVILAPGQNIYLLWRPHSFQVKKDLVPIPTPEPYPVNKTEVYPGDTVSAESVIVTDIKSGVPLFTRNPDTLLAPASTTKILTALVAIELFGLDTVVTVHSPITEGQLMGLVDGEQITVENLIYGALVHSGNDAAFALASAHPNGVEGFVSEMNKKAEALHLDHSHFTNPAGFDDPSHKMTANDLSRLSIAALSNPTITKMVALPQITVSDVTHTYFHTLKNVNQLLGKIPGVAGIKTGWTEEAGENLVTLVTRGGHNVLIVVLHSKDRFGDTVQLIDWVFTNYEWKNFVPVGP